MTQTVSFRAQDDDLLLMNELRRDGESTTDLLRRALRLARTLQERDALRRSAETLGSDPDDLAEVAAVQAEFDAVDAW